MIDEALAGILVAALGAIAIVAAAIIAAVGTAWAWMWRRVLRAEAHNQALWRYTRTLIDHIYRGGGAPPPEPPESIKHLYEQGEPQ